MFGVATKRDRKNLYKRYQTVLVVIFLAVFGTIFIIFSTVFMPNSPLSLLFFFGAQEDATTSKGISIESSAENITIPAGVYL